MSKLTLRRNPVLIQDGTLDIPESITSRISYKTAPKIFVNMQIPKEHAKGITFLVLSEFSEDAIQKCLLLCDLKNLKGVYVIKGLEQETKINGTIPLIGSNMLHSAGCTNVHSTCNMIARSMCFNIILAPWEYARESYDPRYVTATKRTLETTFPYSVFVSSLVKSTSYEDRKVNIQDINAMIAADPPFVDEYVLYGHEDFVTPQRFPDNTIVKITRKTFTKHIVSLGMMYNDLWNEYPSQSIVYICRNECTLKNQGLQSLYCRYPSNTFCILNPVFLPDIPDPKVELFEHGSPDVVYGCMYRSKKRPIACPSVLDTVYPHQKDSFSIAASNALKRKLRVYNPSLSILTWIPSKTKPLFIKPNLQMPHVEQQPHHILHAINTDKRLILSNAIPNDITIPALTIPDGGTEIKTLCNMTNKILRKFETEDMFKLDDKEKRTIDVSSVLDTTLREASDTFFYPGCWIHSPSGSGLNYDGSDVTKLYQSVYARDNVIDKDVIVGVSNLKPITIGSTLAMIHELLQKDNMSVHIVTPETISGTPVTDMIAKELNLEYTCQQITDGYIRGTNETRTMCIDATFSYIGYDPRVLRAFNRSLSFPDESGTFAILVGDTRWHNSIKKCIPSGWDILLGTDATVEDFKRASYIIGTADDTHAGWVLTMFANPSKCQIIEIAHEHNCTAEWFHLASTTLCCKHSYIALKQEPNKQCKRRIRDHLPSYIA